MSYFKSRSLGRFKTEIKSHLQSYLRGFSTKYTIIVESYIPIPVERRSGNGKQKYLYPFHDMKEGDSFWVPGNARSPLSSAKAFGKEHGGTFMSRHEEFNAGNIKGKAHRVYGTRIWRLT